MITYAVWDKRKSNVVWNGTKKDCEDYLKKCNPLNKDNYCIVRLIEQPTKKGQ